MKMLRKTETVCILWGVQIKEKGRWGETKGEIEHRDRILKIEMRERE
jgi:hypothetical protein